MSHVFCSFHFISFHFISFHFISFHFISFHFISFHFISFHFISFHFISFPFLSFHFISFHFISFLMSTAPARSVLLLSFTWDHFLAFLMSTAPARSVLPLSFTWEVCWRSRASTSYLPKLEIPPLHKLNATHHTGCIQPCHIICPQALPHSPSGSPWGWGCVCARKSKGLEDSSS